MRTHVIWSGSVVAVMLAYLGWCLELDIKMNLPVQAGGRQYIYYSDKITWNEAAKYCVDTGGNLAKIDSEDFYSRLINAFEAAYGINPFPEDYWIGIFQPSEGNFRWASDCSKAYYITNINTDWDSNKMCFKFHRDQHDGDRETCSTAKGFICEKPLPSGYSCNMREVFTANALGTEVLDQNACETACDIDSDCWMVVFTPPYGCVKLAYNTVTPAARVQTTNSPVKLKGKFCIEVSMDTSTLVLSTSDSSDTPVVNCTEPQNVPSSVTSVSPPTITPSPTQICTTVFVTTTPVTSCIPQTLTENVYHTLSCSPETSTVVSTPQCTPEISTVSPTIVCSTSACTCSPATSAVMLSPSCPSIEPSTSVISSNSSVNVVQRAEEIARNLTIDEKSTSAYLRKLTSAKDDRPTAKTVGYIGLCFVSLPVILIVLVDFKRMISHCLRKSIHTTDRSMVKKKLDMSIHQESVKQ